MKASDDYDNNNDEDVENDDVGDDGQKWQSTTNFYLNVHK